MDILTLRYFLETARTLHMSRAATELGIAEPALSRKIKSLEAELQVRLFERAHRKITLTSAGEVLLDKVADLIDAADEAIRLTRAADEGLSGPLHIGYSGSALFDETVSSAIRLFARQFPDIDLHLHENPPMPLLKAMQTGAFDVGFARGPIGSCPKQMRYEVFSSSPLAIALPTGHPLAHLESVPFRLLAQEKFVSFNDPEGIGLDSSLKNMAHHAGFEPNITARVDSVASIVSLVMVGSGIAVLPRNVMGLDKNRAIHLAAIEDTCERTDIVLLQRKTSLPVVSRHFLAWLRKNSQMPFTFSDQSNKQQATQSAT